MVAKQRTWLYGAALPNLWLKQDQVFDVGKLCLVGPDHRRLQFPAENPRYTAALGMQTKFKTVRGKEVRPCVLMIHKSAPKRVRTASAVRGLRNAVAFAAVFAARALFLKRDTQWEVNYTDHFDFYPLVPSSGNQVTSLNAIVRQYNQIQHLSMQPSPVIGDPSSFSASPDLLTWAFLRAAWSRLYDKRRDVPQLSKVFRALDAAYHAGRFPTDGLLGLQDRGIRIGNWVSAFEILLHPHPVGNRVGLDSVIDFIEKLTWNAPRLKKRLYKTIVQGKPRRVTLASSIYKQLYDARNAFLHGNKVRSTFLSIRKEAKEAKPLEFVAATLFGAVLKQRLIEFIPALGSYGRFKKISPKKVKERFQLTDSRDLVENALLTL